MKTCEDSAIRTLHINAEAAWGGIAQQTLYLLEGLANSGHPTSLVCQPRSPLCQRALRLPVEVVQMPMHGQADLVATLRLARIIRSRNIDIVHMHTYDSETLGCVATALARRGQRIVTRRVNSATTRDPLSKPKSHPKVDCYIATSYAVKWDIGNNGVDDNRVAVVHDGIDVARFRDAPVGHKRAELGLTPDAVIIGTVAHRNERKGQRYLMDALPYVLERLPHAHLVIAGTAQLYEELAAHAAELGIGRSVTFVGLGQEVPELIRMFDVFVMPSYEPGLCASVPEAMASGVPVVATKVRGIREIITDGENGLLVPVRNKMALVHAIITLLTDKGLSERLAEKGRATVERHFTVNAMVEGTLATYREVLAGAQKTAVRAHGRPAWRI